MNERKRNTSNSCRYQMRRRKETKRTCVREGEKNEKKKQHPKSCAHSTQKNAAEKSVTNARFLILRLRVSFTNQQSYHVYMYMSMMSYLLCHRVWIDERVYGGVCFVQRFGHGRLETPDAIVGAKTIACAQ